MYLGHKWIDVHSLSLVLTFYSHQSKRPTCSSGKGHGTVRRVGMLISHTFSEERMNGSEGCLPLSDRIYGQGEGEG